MSELPLITASAHEVCSRFTLPRETALLLQQASSPREFLAAVLGKKQYVPAIEFLAHALPVREGIWWGCLCVRHCYGDNLSPADRTACRTAIQWLMQPLEPNRAAAKASAEAAGAASPAGALAAAAYLAGGRGAPEPFAAAKSVARAVKLTSLQSGPPAMPRVQRAYAELGIWIAQGNS